MVRMVLAVFFGALLAAPGLARADDDGKPKGRSHTRDPGHAAREQSRAREEQEQEKRARKRGRSTEADSSELHRGPLRIVDAAGLVRERAQDYRRTRYSIGAGVASPGLVTAEANASSLGAFGLPLYLDARLMAAPGLEPLGYETEDYPPVATLAGARVRAGWGRLRTRTVESQQVLADQSVHDEMDAIRFHVPARVGQAVYLGADQYFGYDFRAVAIGVHYAREVQADFFPAASSAGSVPNAPVGTGFQRKRYWAFDLELNWAQGAWLSGPGFLAAFEVRQSWYVIRWELGATFGADSDAYDEGYNLNSIVSALRGGVFIGYGL